MFGKFSRSQKQNVYTLKIYREAVKVQTHVHMMVYLTNSYVINPVGAKKKKIMWKEHKMSVLHI